MARAREAISSQETLVILARATEPTAAPLPASALRLRALDRGDANRYARAIGTDSAATFRTRLSPSSTCYAVEEGERILHASWVTTDCAWTRELRSFVCVTAGDAYVYESFTRADARGRGVYPFALEEICRTLHDRGVERLWVAVEGRNAASLRAVAKAGFGQVLTLRYRRRLGLLTIDVPEHVKTDTTAARWRKKTRIWLPRDGAK